VHDTLLLEAPGGGCNSTSGGWLQLPAQAACCVHKLQGCLLCNTRVWLSRVAAVKRMWAHLVSEEANGAVAVWPLVAQ
jgi:hypothetical protein